MNFFSSSFSFLGSRGTLTELGMNLFMGFHVFKHWSNLLRGLGIHIFCRLGLVLSFWQRRFSYFYILPELYIRQANSGHRVCFGV